MQLGDKKLIVQRASVGAKNSAVGQTAPVQIQVRFFIGYTFDLYNSVLLVEL